MENCLFCKIAAKQIPSTIVYEDQEIIAFRDINPQAPQHILLIPIRHINSMAELSNEDGPLLLHIFHVANQLAEEFNIKQSGYRFVTNIGPDAGQSVLHLHFHLLGGRPLGWPPG
jgi:histidine triad (HIT) family protein